MLLLLLSHSSSLLLLLWLVIIQLCGASGVLFRECLSFVVACDLYRSLQTTGYIPTPILNARPSAVAAKICRSCPLSVRLTFAKRREWCGVLPRVCAVIFVPDVLRGSSLVKCRFVEV